MMFNKRSLPLAAILVASAVSAAEKGASKPGQLNGGWPIPQYADALVGLESPPPQKYAAALQATQDHADTKSVVQRIAKSDQLAADFADKGCWHMTSTTSQYGLLCAQRVEAFVRLHHRPADSSARSSYYAALTRNACTHWIRPDMRGSGVSKCFEMGSIFAPAISRLNDKCIGQVDQAHRGERFAPFFNIFTSNLDNEKASCQEREFASLAQTGIAGTGAAFGPVSGQSEVRSSTLQSKTVLPAIGEGAAHAGGNSSSRGH